VLPEGHRIPALDAQPDTSLGRQVRCVGRSISEWEEFRLYHRKDGKVVKEGDDLMCATRYALMMLRFSSTARSYHNFRRKIVYPKLSIA
jgi:hypothetical protein